LGDYRVVFLPDNKEIKVPEGTTLLKSAQSLHIEIHSICGGKGTCRKCHVQVASEGFLKKGVRSSSDNLSPLTSIEKEHFSEEEIKESYRLACQVKVHGDVVIHIPESSRLHQHIILESGRKRDIKINPSINNYYIELTAPSLQDQRDDLRRLTDKLQEAYQLGGLTADYQLLKDLPVLSRNADWKMTAVVCADKQIRGIHPGEKRHSYGVAVDLGTTTIVAYLCELDSGDILSVKSSLNPQIKYGEDVISRINYCSQNNEGTLHLHESVIKVLNELLEELCAEAGIKLKEIYEMVLAGNTVMHHLFLNINPNYIGRSPFVPTVKKSLNIRALDLGLQINPGANIYLPPVLSGYIGADVIAVLLAEEPYLKEEMHLIIDMGTNAEVVLGNKDQLLTTSSPTGPAFEGANIKYGMRAAKGVINKLRLNPQTLEPELTIMGSDENILPQGIAGSGIIDAVAELRKAGFIDQSGRFNKKKESDRLVKDSNGHFQYVLAWAEETLIDKDIVIHQQDIRAVQLAKAAVYVGAQMLMKELGIDRADKIILAGAFGNFIDRENALVLGLFPDCPLEDISSVGNASGDGAKLALLNREKKQEADSISANIKHLEKSTETTFKDNFLRALAIPHADEPFPTIEHLLPENNK